MTSLDQRVQEHREAGLRLTEFWNRQKDSYLEVHYRRESHAAMAKALGTTTGAVRNRCSRLKLRKKASEWTAIDTTMLREWYESHRGGPLHLQALSRRLGRPVESLATQAAKMGLTQYSRTRAPEDVAAMAVRSREFIAENGHPRGMLGRHHSPETRSLLSQKGLERPVVVTDNERQLRSDRLAARHARGELSGSNTYSRCRRGKRPDLGDHFFRSSWEANYARYLNFLVAQRIIAKWEYEPDTFWFEAIKRGVRSYLPDFKVTEPNGAVYYVEVKGWMDAKSKTKLKRMKKYHPSVDLRLVDAKAYREISRKLGGAIPHWERAA